MLSDNGVWITTGSALADPLEVGNKFATLARLRSSGYSVPAFFCIGASAFRLAARGPGAMKVATELRESIATALRLLTSDTFAVRSCFVAGDARAGEDSVSNPMAGVSETVLRVAGAVGVVAAIEKCWAALQTSDAAAYFAEFGIDAARLAVAVAVQEMVDARASFVAFSTDPVGGTDDVVVAAAHGLGDGLVQERCDASHYVVGRSGKAAAASVTATPGGAAATATAAEGVTAAADAASDAGAAAAGATGPAPLSTEEITDAAELARTIAREMGSAQDIEGAVDQSGRMWLLQARPLVVPGRRRRVFTNLNVSESFPGISAPMTFSVASRFYQAAFGDCYRRFGIRASSLARESNALANMLGYIDGRIFYDITSFYRLHSLSPFFPLIRGGWEKKIGISNTRQQVGNQAARKTRTGVSDFLKMTWTALDVALTNGRRMRSFEAYWTARLPAAQRELDRLGDPMERIEHYVALWADVSTLWGVTLINDTIANTLYSVCRTLLRPIASNGTDGRLAGLLAPPLPTLTERFWHGCSQCVSTAEAGTAERRLAKLVSESGDFCLTGLKLEDPCVGERLDWVHGIARTQFSSRSGTADGPALNNVKLRLPVRLLRWYLAAIIARRMLRRVIAYRDNHRFLRSQLFAYCRKFALGLARDLCRFGIIDDAGDIWFLTDTEAIGALNGHGLDLALSDVVKMRKRSAAAHAALDPPAEFSTAGPVLQRRWQPARHPAGDAGTVRGIGSASGIARGRAAILASPHDAKEVNRKTIVIARTTDPSWLEVMTAAGGLVVERGSMLSHTAITGRLLGLPTVVCARNASQLIPDGALIEVDGAAGTVRIIDIAPAD